MIGRVTLGELHLKMSPPSEPHAYSPGCVWVDQLPCVGPLFLAVFGLKAERACCVLKYAVLRVCKMLSATPLRHAGSVNSNLGSKRRERQSAVTFSVPGMCSATCGQYSEAATSRASSRAMIDAPIPRYFMLSASTSAEMESLLTRMVVCRPRHRLAQHRRAMSTARASTVC